MKKEIIYTDNAPKAIGPYSQGIIVGDFVYTSGQIPIDPHTGVMESDIRLATKQSMENYYITFKCRYLIDRDFSKKNTKNSFLAHF